MAALLHGAAAAGQRLLLAAAGMAAAGAPAPAPLPLPVAQSAAPGPEVGATATPSNTSDSGYTVSFGSSACQNLTGPICYNTAISGENLITGMWVNLLIGLSVYLLFVLFRSLRGFEFYHARLLLPAVSRKPPQLKLHGHQRFWGWLLPVFSVTDEELVRSAGLDALIGVRILSFGVMLFLPMTVAGLAVLLPINYTSDFYMVAPGEELDQYSSAFMRMTISNIQQHSPRLWVHFAFVYLNVFWSSWLIVEYYKEYIALRQTYLVRCTTMPGAGSGGGGAGGSSAAPLMLTPSMHASRSPMKRALAVAQSPTKRGSGSGSGSGPFGSANLRASASSGSLATLGRAMNRLKLPRRNASGAGEDFGEFAFRPSRFGTPSGSPSHGSPTHGPGGPGGSPLEVAGQGGIFTFAGPSRFFHSRNPSRGSPSPPAAVSITADGSAATAQGLAAALSALPPGSPAYAAGADMTTPPPAGQLLNASSGIELTGTSAYRSSTADGTPGVDGMPGASGESTPASDMGRRRPLLAHVLSSSDRAPPDSADKPDRRRTERHRSGSSRPPVRAPAAGAAQQQQQQQQQQQPAASLDDCTSLSFGWGPGLADIGSISLTGGGAGSDTESDAVSPEPRLAGLDQQQQQCQRQQAEGHAAAAAGGSSAALLALEQASRPGSAGGRSTAPLLPLGPDALAALDALPSAPQHCPTSSFDVAAALGFDQMPPNPEEIFAAMLAKSRSGQRSSSGGSEVQLQLHAVYPPGSSSAAPAAGGSGGSGGEGSGGAAAVEGMATRWWAAHHAGSPDTRMLHTNQSITMKGAVRVAARGGSANGRASLAANASLYTCLVMDMPLEKLKLRRIGVFPVMWRALQLEPSPPAGQGQGPLSRGTTFALSGSSNCGLSPGDMPSQEDISAALDDLERGQSMGMDLAGDDALAHAVGLKGWFARIASAWRHRSRYAEWRRDVRWAMYNKRVRIATEMFSELFGADFDSIIPIYPTAPVDKLAHKWDAKLAVLERLQLSLKETPCHAAKRLARLRERIAKLQEEVAALQADIAAERDAVLSDLPSTCFFATFRSQQAAAIASQTNLNPIMQRLFKVLPAPRPDDVNWPALQRSWWQRTLRPLYALPIILFFMLLPIGMFTGAFAQLTVALCGSPADPGSRSDNWYCSDDRWATFTRNTITSLAPSLILSIYHMVFLPVMVYYAAQMEGQHVSLSALDRRCANLFFYWDVFNIFLGALFGGTVLAELRTFLENPSSIWSALGSAIPAASNFFINYVCYRALVMSAFRLFYPHQAVFSAILKLLRILPRAKTPRDKLLEVPPRNCRFGRDIGIPVLMNFVMVCSMCVTSPLILPFGLLYFVGLWAVWRYQALYVYQRQYESGGQFWPLVAHKVVGCQLIMVVFTASVLLFKGGYTQAALLFITLPIYLLKFDNYLRRRYDDLVRQVPLMAVHSAGRSSVPADIYTPPPLRAGGHGWHPEWGKVWQHWGISRYTI